jgi:hypothetical protein
VLGDHLFASTFQLGQIMSTVYVLVLVSWDVRPGAPLQCEHQHAPKNKGSPLCRVMRGSLWLDGLKGRVVTGAMHGPGEDIVV